MIVFDKSVAYEIFLFENDRLSLSQNIKIVKKLILNIEVLSNAMLCFFTNTL